MQKPMNKTADFATRFNLEYCDAQYLHKALTFYRAACGVAQGELKNSRPAEVEQLARDLMRAAMSAKYQPEFPSLSGLQQAIEYMAGTLESGLDDLAEAVREFSEAQAADVRELVEAVRRIGDECKDVAVGIDTHRRMLDNNLDVMLRRMDAKAANDSHKPVKGKSA